VKKVLSVSIAAYNVAQFLEKTLDSFVVPEIMDKIEVIIVNDGSKDNTAEIAKKYVDKYPQTYKLIDKENGGYGSTINASIPIASGKYYRLLDGDDWFDKEELINVVNELEKSDEDMVVAKFKRVFESDGSEKERDETRILSKTSGTFSDLTLEDWFTMHAIIYKTSVLQKNDIRITEHCFYTDQEYDLLPLRYVETIKKIPRCLYCYRIGRAEQSVSPQGLEKHYKEQMKVFDKIFDIYSYVEKQETARDRYILYYLSKRFRDYIKSCLVLSPTKEHKLILKEFVKSSEDKMPIMFNMALNGSGTVKLLVKSHFLAYHSLHKRMLRITSNDYIA
jgi:glycosyltransferase involved in cell wall biosynthesis